jgi:hypothetical protein
MHILNPVAKQVFENLLSRLNDGYLKLDNESGFMPVIFEDIGEVNGYGKLYSVAHYGKLNGDAMRDPDMTFVEKDGEYYPISFRNDYLEIDQEVFKYDEEGNVTAVNYRLQYELTVFANLWMNNIKNQQGV